MFLHASARSLRSCLWLPTAPLITARHASLNFAIDRGIRRSREIDNPSGKSRKGPIYDHGRYGQKAARAAKAAKAGKGTAGFNEEEFIKTGNFHGSRGDYGSKDATAAELRHRRQQRFHSIHKAARKAKREEPKHVRSEQVPEKIKKHVQIPSSIPYTTSASEFIYGTNAVEAALRCSRRKVYKLYVYQSHGEELSPVKIGLRKLAFTRNVPVKMAFAEWDRLLDQMSAGRPHNGCVLEVSPLPQLPVHAFGSVASPDEDTFPVEMAPQTREEAEVNGLDNRIEIHQPKSGRRRYPVVLLLDGIIDTGNMGAIIRSAYYLGIDAIVFAGRNSAPLNPVTIKASAGAAENMRLLKVTKEVQFIQQCQANGWRFYAADAPGLNSMLLDTDVETGDRFGPATQSPSVIMMGSESDGLSRHIKSHADSIVSIPGARISNDFGIESDPARIDSLNVSVAAALLMEMFLKVPLSVSELPQRTK